MKKTHLILFVLFICIAVLCDQADAELTNEQAVQAFMQANQTFSQANNADTTDQARELYLAAAAGYEKIIADGGIHNAKLYYNLANSYLMSDDLGRAILNYRRAQLLDTANPDIHKNLNFARSKRADQFAVTTQKKVVQRLFFWHYDFSMQTRFFLGGMCMTILCLWLILRLWIVKWPAVVQVCIVMLIGVIAMATSVAVEQYGRAENRSGVIISAAVTARQGDSDNYPKSFSEPLHAGVEFDVLEQRGDWLHIQLSNDQDTWIPADAAELI